MLFSLRHLKHNYDTLSRHFFFPVFFFLQQLLCSSSAQLQMRHVLRTCCKSEQMHLMVTRVQTHTHAHALTVKQIYKNNDSRRQACHSQPPLCLLSGSAPSITPWQLRSTWIRAISESTDKSMQNYINKNTIKSVQWKVGNKWLTKVIKSRQQRAL